MPTLVRAAHSFLVSRMFFSGWQFHVSVLAAPVEVQGWPFRFGLMVGPLPLIATNSL